MWTIFSFSARRKTSQKRSFVRKRTEQISKIDFLWRLSEKAIDFDITIDFDRIRKSSATRTSQYTIFFFKYTNWSNEMKLETIVTNLACKYSSQVLFLVGAGFILVVAFLYTREFSLRFGSIKRLNKRICLKDQKLTQNILNQIEMFVLKIYFCKIDRKFLGKAKIYIEAWSPKCRLITKSTLKRIAILTE